MNDLYVYLGAFDQPGASMMNVRYMHFDKLDQSR